MLRSHGVADPAVIPLCSVLQIRVAPVAPCERPLGEGKLAYERMAARLRMRECVTAGGLAASDVTARHAHSGGRAHAAFHAGGAGDFESLDVCVREVRALICCDISHRVSLWNRGASSSPQEYSSSTSRSSEAQRRLEPASGSRPPLRPRAGSRRQSACSRSFQKPRAF